MLNIDSHYSKEEPEYIEDIHEPDSYKINDSRNKHGQNFNILERRIAKPLPNQTNQVDYIIENYQKNDPITNFYSKELDSSQNNLNKINNNFSNRRSLNIDKLKKEARQRDVVLSNAFYQSYKGPEVLYKKLSNDMNRMYEEAEDKINRNAPNPELKAEEERVKQYKYFYNDKEKAYNKFLQRERIKNKPIPEVIEAVSHKNDMENNRMMSMLQKEIGDLRKQISKFPESIVINVDKTTQGGGILPGLKSLTGLSNGNNTYSKKSYNNYGYGYRQHSVNPNKQSNHSSIFSHRDKANPRNKLYPQSNDYSSLYNNHSQLDIPIIDYHEPKENIYSRKLYFNNMNNVFNTKKEELYNYEYDDDYHHLKYKRRIHRLLNFFKAASTVLLFYMVLRKLTLVKFRNQESRKESQKRYLQDRVDITKIMSRHLDPFFQMMFHSDHIDFEKEIGFHGNSKKILEVLSVFFKGIMLSLSDSSMIESLLLIMSYYINAAVNYGLFAQDFFYLFEIERLHFSLLGYLDNLFNNRFELSMYIALLVFIKSFVHTGCLGFEHNVDLHGVFLKQTKPFTHLMNNYKVIGSIITVMLVNVFTNNPQPHTDVASILNYCHYYDHNVFSKRWKRLMERNKILVMNDLRIDLVKHDSLFKALYNQLDLIDFFSTNALSMEQYKITLLEFIDRLVSLILKQADLNVLEVNAKESKKEKEIENQQKKI